VRPLEPLLAVVATPTVNRTLLMSAWRSDRELRADFNSDPYGRYVSAVTDLLTRPSDVTIHTVSGTVHPIADLSREPQRAT
jgi:quinol monooxygenase YgiN